MRVGLVGWRDADFAAEGEKQASASERCARLPHGFTELAACAFAVTGDGAAIKSPANLIRLMPRRIMRMGSKRP